MRLGVIDTFNEATGRPCTMKPLRIKNEMVIKEASNALGNEFEVMAGIREKVDCVEAQQD